MSPALELHQFCKRPGFGTSGQQVKVAANSYRVTKFPTARIHQYDVSIGTGEEKRALLKKVWFSDRVQHAFGDAKHVVLYDGNKLAWSIVPLPFGEQFTEMIDLDEGKPQIRQGRENKHRIVIKKSGQVPLQVTEAYIKGSYALDNDVLVGINFLDHLMRETPSKHFITIKRSFFQSKGSQQLDGGIEAWKGIFQSVRPTQGGFLTLNVDVATAVFWTHGSVLFTVQRLLRCGSPEEIAQKISTPAGLRELKRLKRVTFYTKHRGRASEEEKRHSIESFAKNANDTKFQAKSRDGTSEILTVNTYYYKTYNIRLKYPHLPLIQSKKKDTVFPMELAYIHEGQRYPFKLDDRQTADMIRFTVQRPNVRSEAIKANVTQLDWKRDPMLNRYGMEISPDMIKINARVLKTPKIAYGKGSQEQVFAPRDGRWDLRGKKFAQVTELKSWGIMVCGPPRRYPEQMIQNFVRQFVLSFVGHGGSVVNKEPPILYMDPSKPVEASCSELFNATGRKVNHRPQLLVFILQQKSTQPYNQIKAFCDTHLGVVSQCMQTRHVEQAKGQYCSNVCMKVNAKLGGTTCHIDKNDHPLYGREPTIFLGADVSHGGAFGGGGMKSASFASMVGSLDLQGARYTAICNTNGHRVEMISTANILRFVAHLLRTFKKKTGKVPVRVFYFRDGVSEGQYAQVIEQELEDIKQACRSIQADYKPLITVVVCTKRHHTRLFPIDKNASDRNGNVVPGTIIERDITHPTEYDFFLNSHPAIQGTARSTKYTVIHDENKMPIDLFQSLIYNFCYTYMRATTSVSIIPPVYYAHLASARARAHDVNPVGETTPSGETSQATPSEFADLKRLHDSVADQMWFI